ncbi:SPAG8 protein, partial [Centropus unirufus]|nr:SPAG8 protein [Centropus unirufus]
SSQRPRHHLPRGSCLIHNWLEERVTNHLDAIPGEQMGNESYIYRHGHRGLLTHDQPSSPSITTMKDSYRPPQMDRALKQGEAQLPLTEPRAPPKRQRREDERSPKWMPMESVSTTHRDYCARGQDLKAVPTTQRHFFYTDQPCSFWVEQARSLPQVTSIRSGKSPFRRNAAFSNSIIEHLGLPLPSAPSSSQSQHHKQ